MALTDLPERAVRRFDDYQQTRWWLAHPVGTVRKYADDRGTAFAGLVTFQMFLGMLPLLVVVLTVLGNVLAGSDQLRDAALESTLAQFPVIGQRLREDVMALSADGLLLGVSIAGLLWTAAGIYHGMQLALNQVWNVEGIARQGFVSRHLRAVVLFVLVISAAIGTAFVRGEYVLGLGPSLVTRLGSTLVGAGIAAVLLLGVFRIVVAPVVPTSRLVPAAALAGCFWELLQLVGSRLVMEQLAPAEDLYGGIGFVVVTLLWINLLARSAVFANEWAVVSWEGLWPRRLAQPPLTDADQDVLRRLARNERRRPEESIDVEFDDSDPDSGTAEQNRAGDERGERPSRAESGAAGRTAASD
jgi:YihY family inner membrane protein